MKFNKLYIHGFKSFVEKTTVDFNNGITAIVGPNGSGKSNIMDAVRWVFGEQNPKELRGAEMDDIVFNGTQKRKAMGPLAPNSQYDRKPFYYPIYHDKNTPWAQVTLDPDGEHLSHWDHPVDETDYELPEPFKNAYGIIAWNDMLGPHRPTVTLPEGYGQS